MYHIFEGETLSQALLKMQIELGNDAIIVDHQQVKKGGIFGLFGHTIYKVRALKQKKETKENSLLGKSKEELLRTIRKKYKPVKNTGKIDHLVDDTKPIPSFNNNNGIGIYNKQRIVTKDFLDNKKNEKYAEELNGEIKRLRTELKKLSADMKKIVHPVGVQDTAIQYPGKLSELYITLIENEVDEKLADILIKKVRDELTEDEVKDPLLVKKIMEKKIVDIFFNVKKKVKDNVNKPSIKIVTGPTGVGKTTTIAKLGANYSLLEKKKVAFLTVDTYRLAAYEQLQKYAEIIEAPLNVIFKPDELHGCINGFLDKDVILIDTAGRSQNNSDQMNELLHFIEASNYPIDIYLAISATTKYTDMLNIAQKFMNINYTKFIFTKLDETLTYGPIFSLICRIKKPVEFVTFGQEVPDDIELFDPKRMANKILSYYKG